MTHKSEDYKISAVKYYLKNKDNIKTKIYTLCEGKTLLIFNGIFVPF